MFGRGLYSLATRQHYHQPLDRNRPPVAPLHIEVVIMEVVILPRFQRPVARVLRGRYPEFLYPIARARVRRGRTPD
jgi:hypothetical protein